MIIASIKSNKYPSLNGLNEIPFVGGTIIACMAMLPMFAIHELIQLIVGVSEVFELKFTFFLNNFCFHLLLIKVFDIRMRIFFIPSTIFCLIGMIISSFREYDLIVAILNS